MSEFSSLSEKVNFTATYCGKTIKSVELFKKDGKAFTAVAAAEKKAESLGFSYGSMCCDEPMGLVKGDIRIAKWWNIRHNELPQLDGALVSLDMREDDVALVIFD
jgi:hypothetical protein